MRYLMLLALLFWTLYLAGSPGKEPGPVQPDSIDRLMNSLLVHEGKQPVHNVLLYAKNGQSGTEIDRGYGIIGRDETLVTSEHQFKIASITKTYVAVIILQLIEEGKLDYDDLAYTYLSDLDYVRFEEIHQLDGVAYAKKITLEHLLRHTSGIGDIFTDKETRFILSVLTHKKRMYDKPRIMKRFYKYKLHKQPTNIPGEGYHYSDMNFMLLGMVAEQVTGQSLPQLIRERILEPLEMVNTYFEYYEQARGTKQQIDTYLNRINITKKINTSYEWGGGGLVSTVSETGRFAKALFQGELFQHPETLDRMMDMGPTQVFGKNVAMGLFHYTIDGISFYGHGGFYGSLMLHAPEEDITICIHVGQANAAIDPYGVMGELVTLVR
jgi:D-alanyl-D-alanine carboxypeptidase